MFFFFVYLFLTNGFWKKKKETKNKTKQIVAKASNNADYHLKVNC